MRSAPLPVSKLIKAALTLREPQFNIVVGVADDSGVHGALNAQSCVTVIEPLK
jgi:2-phospho-L-lactate transferase/gluconeogenesis factor (CofD/UPF0052 family)